MTIHRADGLDEDLSRFRFHTGATLRRLAPGEPCRTLFRDIGPRAMALFLRGQLKRLAGPFAPILYCRTADYHEPYLDYEPIGRLVFLRPRMLSPWHSGVPNVFVASLHQHVDPQTIGFVPPHIGLAEAERALQDATDIHSMRESFGRIRYDEIVSESLAALDRLNLEQAESERWAEPLRRKLQSPDRGKSEWAKGWLADHALCESDLCSAWHHLPRKRRNQLVDSLRELAEVRPC